MTQPQGLSIECTCLFSERYLEYFFSIEGNVILTRTGDFEKSPVLGPGGLVEDWEEHLIFEAWYVCVSAHIYACAAHMCMCACVKVVLVLALEIGI